MQTALASSAVSLEREAAIIAEAALESSKAAGALDFDLQVQDMSKVRIACTTLAIMHEGLVLSILLLKLSDLV